MSALFSAGAPVSVAIMIDTPAPLPSASQNSLPVSVS